MNLLTLMLLGGLSLSSFAKIHCHGTGEKQAVLLIHGSPGSADDWNPLLQHPFPQNQIISFDRAGYGTNTKVAAATSLSEQLPLLRQALQCNRSQEKAIVVGYSYGGALAVLFALENPELIERLILLAPSLAAAYEKLPWYKRSGLIPFIHRFLPRDWRASLTESEPLPRELDEIKIRLAQLNLPIRYLHGTDDRVVNVKTADYARKHLPKIQIQMVPDLDHDILARRPDLIRDLILE